MTTLIIIAKECMPGRVKTRLHPPLSLEQAATLASASLADTFRAVSMLDASRRILLFDGNLFPLGSEPYDVIHQVSGDLDMRLGAIFDECEGPTVLVGMDTPQLDATMLAPLFAEWPTDTDAYLGLANDGGYWTIAMAEPDGSLIRGVPMSRDNTGQLQLERLTEAGLRVRMLPELIDVDTFDDARHVADLAPNTEFARTLAALGYRSAETTSPETGTDR